MPKKPRWKPPADMAQALVEGDGVWEDERWSPILITAMSGTEYAGRAIPVAWQVELDPSADECEAANARLAAAGVEPDGYGWGEYLQGAIRAADPGLAERLRLTDCEAAACVIWVESEADCRVVVEAAWGSIFTP